MPEERQDSNAIKFAELDMYDPRKRNKDGTYAKSSRLGNKIACQKGIETIAQLIRARAAKGDTSYEKEGRVLGFKEEFKEDVLIKIPDCLIQIFLPEYKNDEKEDLGWKFCGHSGCKIKDQPGRVSLKSKCSAPAPDMFWIVLTRCSPGDDRHREEVFGGQGAERYGQVKTLQMTWWFHIYWNVLVCRVC
tara:strand:- start:14864 stop:15433 length:570 start_codon:yes stop_codon:yes gene_type:complete